MNKLFSTIPAVRWPRLVARVSVLISFLALLSTPCVRAADSPPDRMSYQGFLVDGNGIPLATNGPVNYNVVFRIYAVSTEGTSLWTEQQVVTVDNGAFSVVLGEGSSVGSEPGPPDKALSSVFKGTDASERYIGLTVTIGTDSLTLLPRLRLLPAPYAFLARHANEAAQANHADQASRANALVDTNGKDIISAGSVGTLAKLHVAENMLMGTNAFQKTPWLFGDILMDNGTGDTPGILFYTGHKTNYGIDVFGDALRFVRNMNEEGGKPEVVLKNGRVGIGTQNPRAPLEVDGSADLAPGAYHWLAHLDPPSTTGSNPGTEKFSFSIIASKKVLAQEFNAISDRRVKEVVGVSDSEDDLKTVRKLSVKNYKMLDKVAEGDRLHRGFIAQEVQSVIPEAVNTTKGFIPDIFVAASSYQFDAHTKALTVTVPVGHSLRAGDRVRLMADDRIHDAEVRQIGATNIFVAAPFEKAPENLFVYGKEINDFLSLDYDRLFTTGIGAIQEMAKQIDALKKSEARLTELEEKAAQIDSLEAEVAGLKELVARLAQTVKDENSSRAGAPSSFPRAESVASR